MAHGQITGAIDHQSERTVRAVLADIGHGAGKIGIGHGGHGDQKMIGQVDLGHDVHG